MIFYEDEHITVCHGDALDILRQLPDNSVDSVVTDPPYALSFMGKDWDAQHPNAEIWKQCLRILKPGGHLLSFGGTRTWHRLACDIEDAGFEIRDNIAWLYGSGFPKSMDVSKAIDKAAGAEREVVGRKTGRAAAPVHSIKGGKFNDTQGAEQDTDIGVITAPATDDAKRWAGWGTALKPAFEPIVVGRKPLIGTVAATVLAHGTGALNIDGCRVAMQEGESNPSIARYKSTPQKGNAGWDHVNRGARFDESAEASATLGRWPSNVALDESQAAALDADTKPTKSTGGQGEKSGKLAQNVYGDYAGTTKGANAGGLGDEGGVSRYFPTFKYQAKAPKKERPVVEGTAHPTVKPLDLMRWLVRLVTPPDGWVLDPFAGSGTTGEAALAEGRRCVLIERQEEYLPLIKVRLDRAEHGLAAICDSATVLRKVTERSGDDE